MAVWCGLNAAGQAAWLPKDRIMLFNDYPAVYPATLLNPEQSYYNTNWWHDAVAAPGHPLYTPGPLALLTGVNHTFTSTTDDGRRAIWKFTNCRLGSPYRMDNTPRVIPPANGYDGTAIGYLGTPITTNWMAILRNIEGSMIETPFYPDGVGTLYFDAINVFAAPYTNQVVVQIATNMFDRYDASNIDTLYEQETERYSNCWATVSVTNVNHSATNLLRYQFTFNYRHAARIRIWKTVVHGADPDNFFVAVDNIRISRPPSDVRLSRPEVICNPGYPSINTGFTVRCIADNFGTNVYERTWATGGTTSGRTLQLYYRWRYLDQMSNAWNSVNMSHVTNMNNSVMAATGDGFGNGEVWEGSIPAQPTVGDLEYYYVVDFKGYRYQPRDYTIAIIGDPMSNPNMYWPGTEHSETITPRTFRGDTSHLGGREFYVRLRPYPSSFRSISVVTGPPYSEDNPIQMTQISNGVWRGMVPVNNRSATNSFYFKGEGEYSEGSGTGEISSKPVYWTDPSPALAASTIPFGGRCTLANTPITRPISVISEGGGYMQVLFDMNEMTYMTSRAEYQNFNTWQAPAEVFTDSNGQATKQQLINTFDAWPVNGREVNVDIFQEFFLEVPMAEDSKNPFTTLNGWVAGSAKFIEERKSADLMNRPGSSGPEYRNRALRLKGGSAGTGLGYVHNQREALPDGLKEITFKARLGQPANPLEAVWYRPNLSDHNYQIRVKVQALSLLPPERPTVSLLGYYLDADTFYEFRLAQVPDTSQDDKQMLASLYKWVGGVERLMTSHTVTATLSTETEMELRLYTTSTGTTIRGQYGAAASLEFNDLAANTPLTMGTCGFLSSECDALFSDVRIAPMTGASTAGSDTTILSTGTGFENEVVKWAFPAGRWEKNEDTPRGIRAATPKEKIGVYLQKTQRGTVGPEPQAPGPGSPTWELVDQLELEGFSYKSYTNSLYKWQSNYVMLQVMGQTIRNKEIDVIVDELEVSAWRGQTSSDRSPGETVAGNLPGNGEWVAQEAWVDAVWVPGLSEGRVPGAFNMDSPNPSPMTSTQLSTRYANMSEGWVTNSTYIYNGRIYLNGPHGTNVFARNFNGNMYLKIGNTVVFNGLPSSSDPTNLIVFSGTQLLPIELRLGFGADGVGGPISADVFGGYGVAYSRDVGQTWVPLEDKGDRAFIDTEDKRVTLDITQEGRVDDMNESSKWVGQAVRSPLLTTGVGLLEFDYLVEVPPAKLTVQFAQRESSTVWTDVKSFVVSNAMTEFNHALAYLGTNTPGYLRVLNDRGVPGEEYTNAVVIINNAAVWDEPEADNTSWRAYNMKITDTDLQRVMLDESKAGFLNNSQIAETDPLQTVHPQSFIKSPLLPTGLGSLSFMARTYTNGQDVALRLFVTTHDSGPGALDTDELCEEILPPFVITTNLYETFTYTPIDGRDIRAFKLAIPTLLGDDKRVCVEELAVSEPVLPGFDINGVIPMCIDGNEYGDRRQPLHSDQVGFQAQISNRRLTPVNINLFVDYYVGTNYWGVDNWPKSEVKTLEMEEVETDVYRTTPFLDIPPQEKNSVVQYCVWAKYTDEHGTELTVRQKEASFTNPDWYYPVDLNKTFATKGWAPYFIVYDVPVGAVWINEINGRDPIPENGGRDARENSFIEIAVPAGFDLAGWHVDILPSAGNMVPIIIPAGTPVQEPVTNEYAFFVIGETASGYGTIPPLPKQDYPGGFPNLQTVLSSSRLPRGIYLRRPLGMYEQVVAFDYNPEYFGQFDGQTWAELDSEQRLEYVGTDFWGKYGSLCVTNTLPNRVPRTNDWVFIPWGDSPDDFTPGKPNVGQNVPNAVITAPGVSNMIVISRIPSSYGTQNGLRRSELTFRIKQGESTNIVYVADAWYRLKSITVNGESQFGSWTSNSFVLANVQTNLNIDVSIGLRDDVSSLGIDNNKILNWLMGFDDKPLAPSWYYGLTAAPIRELSLLERYWFDANPTKTNILRGGVLNIERDPAPGTTNFFMTARLDLNDMNITNLMGTGLALDRDDAVFKIIAKPRLTDPWRYLNTEQYRFNELSFNSNHITRVFVRNPAHYTPEYFSGYDFSQLFFGWVIEYEDPRWSKPVLVPTNSPTITFP